MRDQCPARSLIAAMLGVSLALCAWGCDSKSGASESSSDCDGPPGSCGAAAKKKKRPDEGGRASSSSTGAGGASISPKAANPDATAAIEAQEKREKGRQFTFTYRATIKPGDAEGAVDIFLPIAVDTPYQTIENRTIETELNGSVKTESTYRNKYWHASLDSLPSEPISVTVRYDVDRRRFEREALKKQAKGSIDEQVREKYQLYLKPNKRVPVSGDLIEKVASDIGLKQKETPLAAARAIYDYVIDTMEYKKVGDGWGNGDTYWACTEKYGNCTDFHALFTSLARYRDIPARFDIGFPVPRNREAGQIGGYHCWIDFYLPGVGWTPIDASEAKKRPEMRELFFGAHPADRIHFTTGRDLVLGEAHDSKPLNYFIYPMVEVGGERYDGVETTFSYSEPDS